MVEKIPSKSEIFDAVGAQAESIDGLSRRITNIEGSADKQEARNQNITIGVLFAFLFIVVTVAAEVLLSNRSDNQRSDNYLEKIHQEELKNVDLQYKLDLLHNNFMQLQSQLDALKNRNSYLK